MLLLLLLLWVIPFIYIQAGFDFNFIINSVSFNHIVTSYLNQFPFIEIGITVTASVINVEGRDKLSPEIFFN